MKQFLHAITFTLCIVILMATHSLRAQEEYSTDFSIAFQINHQDRETAVYQGEPLIFYFGLSNPKAMNAYYYNLAKHKEIKEVKAVTLGTDKLPWTKLVSFFIEDKERKQIPSWKGNITGDIFRDGLKAMALLDGENTAEGYFVISPQVSGEIPLGTYHITVVIDTRGYKNYPMWQGRAVSDVFILKIIARPSQLSGKALKESYELNGRYYLLIEDFNKVKEFAEKILATDVHSLVGLSLLAWAWEGLKEYDAAIDILQKSEHEFWRQYPRSYEPPEEIIYRIQRLKEKLGKK
ncbi:MAG: hypothetical protein WC658_05530 [Candidatus Omnitrophota bacterium]